MKVETLKREDYIPMMRFLEKSYNHTYHFFPLKYPHVWKEETTDYENCFLIKENGEIVSHVRVFPLQVWVENVSFSIGGIGGVATLPPYRGRGYMSLLMKHTLKIMEERGYPFSILGGDRQRYAVFGYETCGREVVFRISIRSLEKPGFGKKIEVRRFSGEKEVLIKIIQAHESFPLRIKRTEDDYLLLLTTRVKTLIFYAQEEDKFSYLVAEGEGEEILKIHEVGGEPEILIPLIYNFLRITGKKEIEVHFPLYRGKLFSSLFQVASSFRVKPLGMIRIMSLQKTLKCYLPLLSKKVKGEKDNFTLKVKESGEKVGMVIDQEGVKLSEEEIGEEVCLGRREWAQVLFGPFPPYLFNSSPLLSRLFPLDFYWWYLDWI